MEIFKSLFDFRPEMAGLVGVERESFLVDDLGNLKPMAETVLKKLTNREKFGFELSACQLEDRVGPLVPGQIGRALLDNDEEICRVLGKYRLRRSFKEVAPSFMPLDIYPDPSGRYAAIAAEMSKSMLLSACRVIGTHVHVGMPDHKTALRVYNAAIGQVERLCRLGDKSHGKRLAIYSQVAPDCWPPSYGSWEEFHEIALAENFVHDPRRCWHLIRISVHGTIEFRMFGASADTAEIVEWVNDCCEICKKAMPS